MLSTLNRSRLARTALAGFLFTGIGYGSNALTAPACERATDGWLGGWLSAGPASYPFRHAASLPAAYRLPWIVAVDYERVVGHEGDERGTRYYVSLLGVPVPVRSAIRMEP